MPGGNGRAYIRSKSLEIWSFGTGFLFYGVTLDTKESC